MSDIRREDVIAFLSDMVHGCHSQTSSDLLNIMDAISMLPSAQECKTGKWIDKGYGEYRCSVCRNVIDVNLDFNSPKSIEKFKYCPFCGAKLGV